jgi:alpha-galactosidase
MRTDYGLLAILQLASSSDQNDYRFYPAIAAGGMASVLPEQLAVWSCPKVGEDREAAVFNMVNALLCRIHLSGQLADIPAEQFDVVREGIALYKQSLRRAIPRAIPFWPLGRRTIEQRDGFMAVGLRDADGGAAWLAVWRLGGDDTAEIPLGALRCGKACVRQAFPEAPERPLACDGNTLRVRFPAPWTAAVFAIAGQG